MNVFVLGGEGLVASALSAASKPASGCRHNAAELRTVSRPGMRSVHQRQRQFQKVPRRPGSAGPVRCSWWPRALRTFLDFACKRDVYLSTIDVYPCVDNPAQPRDGRYRSGEAFALRSGISILPSKLLRKYADRWLICRLGGMVAKGYGELDLRSPARPAAAGTRRIAIPVHEHRRRGQDRSDARSRRQPESDVFQCLRRRLRIAFGNRAHGRETLPGPSRPRNARRERYEVNVEKTKSVALVPERNTRYAWFVAQRG